MKKIIITLVAGALLASCGSKENNEGNKALSGNITIDGSSTVGPISQAVAEEFRKEQPEVKVTIGISGTGGGFKRFGRGEIDINDASRPIKKAEDSACAANKVSYKNYLVAYDGLAVVVNPQNDWCKSITVAELKKIWEPDAQGKITKWSQVREGWPDQEIHLFGAGTESGTFDYFTEVVCGKAKASRGDYTASEDDNTLVQGVSGDKYALGYFGLAYYEENKTKISVVPVDNGNGTAVSPSLETVRNKTYAPLGRPLYIYVTDKAESRPEVQAFLRYYLENTGTLSKEVGYVPMADDELVKEKAKLEADIKAAGGAVSAESEKK